MKFKKALCLAVALVICALCLCACGAGEILTTTFTCGDFSITLPKYFKEKNEDKPSNFSFYYSNNDIEIVLGAIETKTSLASNGYDVKGVYDYACLVAELYGEDSKIEQKDNYYYIIYERTVAETEFKYITCFFENDNSYLSVTYTTYKSVFNLSLAQTYMKTVEF